MSFVKRLRRITAIIFVLSVLTAQNRDEVVELTHPVTGSMIDTNFVDVTFTVASFFVLGHPQNQVGDGYAVISLDGSFQEEVYSVTSVTINGLTEGSHFLEIELIDFDGNSFSPVVYDSATFTVDMASVPNLCSPRNLSVVAGDTRNFLNWYDPIALSNLNPFPAVPQSADYHTGTTNASAFPENSLIQGHGGPAASKEAGWAIFDIAGLNPNIEVDTIIFNYYVNAANWPYWSATAVDVNPLTASASDVHTDITDINGSGLTTAYLYQNEPSTFGPGWYSNMLINGANDDLESDITQGYFVIGVVDRDGSTTFFLDIDGWNEANPPSIDIHWSAPGGRQGVYHAPAIADIPYSEDEITAYKKAVSEGLTPPTALAGIGAYETESHPNSSPREIIEGCGDFQNYSVYTSDGTVVATLDTNYYIHENLTNGTEYCYYVVANYTEGASSATATVCATPETFLPDGITNLNAVGLDEEIALSWTDPSVPQYTFFENFNSGIPATWTITDNNSSGIVWEALDTGPSAYTLDDYDGLFAIITSYSNTFPNSDLISPSIDLSNYSSATLYYNFNYQDFALNPTDSGLVYISGDGGSTWTLMNAYGAADTPPGGTNAILPDSASLNSVVGSSDVKIKFHYEVETGESWFFSVDDIIVIGSETSRDTTDGDLLGYNVYVDGSATPHNSVPVEETSYVADGLTNGQSYTVGVTAVFYPDYESAPLEATASPTWLYGDISGTVSDPNGNLLDSAIVRTGTFIDTTGADGTYFLDNLEPGVHTVSVQRQDFENDSEEVTVIAQAAAVVQDFILTPDLARANGLEATAGDHQIDLIWKKPGAGGSYELYYYDDILESQLGCGGGCEFGVRFTPLGYPATLTTILLSVQGDASVLSGNILAFIDDAGSIAGPGGLTPVTLAAGLDLSSPDQSLTQYEIDVSAAGVVVNSGDIYIMIQENSSGWMGIANDVAPQSPEYYDRNWVMTGGLYQTVFDAVGGDPSLTGDFGLLATFDGASLAAATLNNNNEVVELIPEGSYEGIFMTEVAADYDIESKGYQRIPNPDNVVRLTNIHIPEPSARSRTDSLIGYNIYQSLEAGDTLVATNTGADDTTATITVPDNYVEYCYNVRARWNTDSYGLLESKPTSDACAIPYTLGDVDFNSSVDISDLLTVVDFVLEVSTPSEEQFRGADVNVDEEITINDVVMIVDIIYGTAARTMASADATVLADLLSADQQLLISLDYDGLTRGIQFELDANAALEFGTPLLAVNDNGTMVMSHRAEDGTVSVVVINTSGGTIERSENVLIRLPYTFKGDRRDKAVVELKELKAAGMAGESLPVTIREKRIDIMVVPSVFALHQNYPNPFNPVTEIQFDVPVESKVKLTIYNLMGQEVTTLSHSTLEAGFHSVRWDGTNGLGEQVGTGLYFYRLSSPSFTSTKKMILVK